MRVIGTAGHVDHGKSTLVKCLTGIDPDRLAEEKAREMTIDLGFAWLTLRDGETVGIVDVPGHRDFIANMLAGVGGIDAALLVIAADEGIMPQTREHLAILDLLGIHRGLIILTKIDLIDDPDWLELVTAEIAETLEGTAFETAEFVPVSAYTGEGIPLLVDRIAALLEDTPPRTDLRQPRLPIDRVFSITGFGTVVTGTLIGGSLSVGDEVELHPSGLRGRIRGLQSYKQPVESVTPGIRVAVNIAGVERQLIARGHVMSYPRQMRPTTLVDVRFRQLPDVDRPLKHNAEVKIFVGAAETTARVRLLDADTLLPGGEGWIQLRLADPLALAYGDRCILRYPSPAQTIGGGVIVNPHPEKRWRRFQPAIIDDLETRMRGTPAERVAQAAAGLEPMTRGALGQRLDFTGEALQDAIADALNLGLVIELADGLLLSADSFRRTQERMRAELRAFHAEQPLRLGMPREALRSRIGVKNATLTALLEPQSDIVSENTLLRLSDHAIRFTPAQEARARTLRSAMRSYTPPSYEEAVRMVGEDLLHALIDLGEIVQLTPDVVLSREIYDHMVARVFAAIDANGSVTVAAVRDQLGTSRKYALALLEHLDGLGKTRREGDARVRGRAAITG